MSIHKTPNRGPIPALMYHIIPARCMVPYAARVQLRGILLQRSIRTAQDSLPQVAQTVLDMMAKSGAVRYEPDADDVQAVQLVHHRDLEGTIERADLGEAVGLKERAPLVIVEQAPVFGVFPDEADAPNLDGQLRGVV